MENQRRLWHRLVSRLRGNNRGHSYIPYSSGGSNIRGRTNSYVQDNCVPGRYARFVRDPVRTRPHLTDYFRNWHTPRNFVASSFGQGLANRSFTPKCLTGLNTNDILMGRGTFDDFSSNCWLENHLHRFGAYENDPENEQNDAASSSNESARNSYRNNTINTYSSSSGSTVSDITHFYNNMNITGYAFDPDRVLPGPPPYSEFPDDPPPPYAEIAESLISTGRGPSSLSSRCSSTQLMCQDILW